MTTEPHNEYRQQRLANMEALADMGYAPFGGAFERTGSLARIRASFEVGREVAAAGRLVTIRKMGKSVFADLRDGTGRFQVLARRDVLGEAAFGAFKRLDVGDHVGVEGPLMQTRTGEQTVELRRWTMLAKALLPLPEKWHGLRDVDARYRQRYLDLVANPEIRELFDRRIEAVAEIRRYLRERGFAEVETPMIQPHAGGAAAKPFVTRYEALHTDMYLRIAPELYLKQLLVGGFDRVFELNRCFRNEGLSRTHLPEFTMLEIYEAYSDLSGMRRLVEGLIRRLAEHVFGSLRVPCGETTIDLAADWREVSYRELICEAAGEDWFDLSLEEAQRRAAALDLALEPDWDFTLVTHEVYEKRVEHTLTQPTFVTRFPAALVPLARPCADDPQLAEVFELVMAGQEIAPAYTELNDPLRQRRRLEEQAGGDASRVDEDFLTALEHGMPPAGGMGVGVDRLIAVLSGSESIRDVVLFPQLRPK